jgi:predicted transposase/invertase (TIGR01784 family)
MMSFADVKNDVAFHKIFVNEHRTESLISFLNAILEWEDDQRIVSVTILNPFQLPKLADGKAIILDVKATDQAGRTYIVEMQVAAVEGFEKRVLYYFATSYSDQIQRGDLYRELKPVIFIGILDFIFTKNPHYLSRNQVRDVETNEQTLSDVEFNFIELPKFTKTPNELQTLADKWIYFIKNAELLNVIPDNVNDEGLESAYREANKHTWTRRELANYDYSYMREEDERARMDYAINVASREAREEGMREGIEQGIEQGMEEGMEEGIYTTQRDIARKMIASGLDTTLISTLTTLSLEQIEQLRTES